MLCYIKNYLKIIMHRMSMLLLLLKSRLFLDVFIHGRLYSEDMLRRMRQIDDKIIYMLNTTIPTESFKGQMDPTTQCKDLFQQIESEHKQRTQAITRCVDITKQKVIQLKDLREKNGNENPTLIKNLRNEQTKLRLLQSELNIEEVVKKRTIQVYYERCRGFYKPLRIST
ncbi:PREDICTED: coiled-coil domain-containing protein 58 isoform X2 [Cyphomyrmex costatus]|uniref:coiled-coil domain-containing protein 58 isoform X2 n=1 Tax=Cyphomyrmex costatus TaxID=456900 RepID=UPI0008522DD3|nr:PREDICTED: coiled-coil domain-containing protein 58 isoform X2 [Cyphomyrmex costatus]